MHSIFLNSTLFPFTGREVTRHSGKSDILETGTAEFTVKALPLAYSGISLRDLINVRLNSSSV